VDVGCERRPCKWEVKKEMEAKIGSLSGKCKWDVEKGSLKGKCSWEWEMKMKGLGSGRDFPGKKFYKFEVYMIAFTFERIFIYLHIFIMFKSSTVCNQKKKKCMLPVVDTVLTIK
jgi:hypothetical protein